MAEPIGKAAAHAPDQRAEFRSRPAIAAIQDELDRLSLIQQPAEGLLFASCEISIQHKQHQVHLVGNVEGETGVVAAVDFIESRCVDQLDPIQSLDLDGPKHTLLVTCTAVKNICGHHRSADQCIDQAGFADPHTARNSDAQMAILQSCQLLINLLTFRIQTALFP